MKVTLRRQAPLAILVGLSVCAPAHAVGVLTTDGSGCPTISDHQRFMDEMEKGNYAYRYPPRCVALPRGTRVGDPIARKREHFGKESAEFIQVEVAGKGKYWTLASWVKMAPPGTSGALGAHPTTLKVSEVRFAKELRSRFQDSIPIHGSDYAFDRIACLPRDITTFEVSARLSGPALEVEGSVKLSALPSLFRVIDGAQGAKYMLLLQAYLFSPKGRLVWKQQGFPQGRAWVRGAGDSVTFRLIGSFAGNLSGHELLIVAAGDPILSEVSETRVILGARKMRLP